MFYDKGKAVIGDHQQHTLVKVAQTLSSLHFTFLSAPRIYANASLSLL